MRFGKGNCGHGSFVVWFSGGFYIICVFSAMFGNSAGALSVRFLLMVSDVFKYLFFVLNG